MNVVLVHVSLRFVTLVRSHERSARPCFFAIRALVRSYERRAVHVSLRFVPLVRSYERRAGPRFFALRVISPQNVVLVHVSLRFVH